MSQYKILKFKIDKNKGSSLINEFDVNEESPENAGTAGHELALKVLARAVGVEYYFTMNAEVRQALTNDIEKALNEFRPSLKSARTTQLEQNKQAVATETVQFIKEVRDAILDVSEPYNGHSLKRVQNAVELQREEDLGKRVILEKQQQHLADEEVVLKYANAAELPANGLKKAFPDAYDLILNAAAKDLRLGKADDETLKVLGFDPEQRLEITNNVSQELETVKTHGIKQQAQKNHVSAVGRG